jgi:hypothetical protein
MNLPLTLPGRALAVAATLLLLSASTASANGAGAVSVTQTFHNAVATFPTVNPCAGEPGTVTITYNGVVHSTLITSGAAAGTGHGTATTTGDFVFTPFDPAGVSYTGHVTMWDGQNFNLQNAAATFTFNVHGTGSDGSSLRFHEVAHLSVSASGITVSFDKPSCG